MMFPLSKILPLIIIIVFAILLFVCLYFYFRRSTNNQRPIEFLPHSLSIPSTTSQITHDIYPQISLTEFPSNYQAFDLTKRSRQQFSSDSSYESSTTDRNYSFGTIKSKASSESIDDLDDQSTHENLAYSLIELFRIEMIYKLYYQNEKKELILEIIRLIPMQNMIEQCFRSIQCKIRLLFNHEKDKKKTKQTKYLSKKNPIKELFQFDFDQTNIQQSYIKIHFLAFHHENNKRMEIGQTVLVIHQYQHLNDSKQQYTKFIQIYEDRIDMIVREQAKTGNDSRALICLVYENARCLLHVGVIKILGIQYLLKQTLCHFHHRDKIQIKISTNLNGKLKEKHKSKLISIVNGSCTFSRSFHVDNVSMENISVSISISYQRSLISSKNKTISMIEFGLAQKQNEKTMEHWNEMLTTSNRPHVHWHRLEPLNDEN